MSAIGASLGSVWRCGATVANQPARDPWAARRALLARHFLLREAREGVINRILQFASVRKVPEGQVLFCKGDAGDGLYGVLTGRVRIYAVANDGREVVLNMLGPSDLFGEIALLDGKPRTAHAATLEDSELLFVPRGHFLTFLEQEPSLMAQMIAILCDRLRWTSASMEDAVFLDLPARLAKRLLDFVGPYGEKTAEGVRLTIRLPQRLLAAMTGATREAVNKVLMHLRSANIVEIENGRLLLRDLDALKCMAERNSEDV
jgi:CRP/FNR family cyclic AMP-dependent transcriptional regulator